MAFGFGFAPPTALLSSTRGPSLSLVFAGATSLDPRITFTRNSTATYFNSSGVLTSAAANAPRFDYDPVTLAARGLLIEEQRTNLLLRSEEFDNASWVKGAATITANAAVSPDGTQDADKLVESTANASHEVAQSFSATSGTAYTFSVYIKAAERPTCQLVIFGAAFTESRTWFNLATLTANTTVGAVSAASVVQVGNGWYKVSVTQSATATGSGTPSIRLWNGSTAVYAGDGTSGIYIWGAQLEAGAFPTSYIPTTTAQATRIADSATMTGTNFSSWYNASEGTLYGEADTYSAAINCGIVSPNDGTANNRMQLFGETNAAVSWYATAGGVNSMWISSGNRTANSVFKVAGAYATNNAAASLNGAAAVTDSSVTIPTVNRLSIGALYSGAYLNGHIKRIAYYPRRLTNAELQGITT